MTNREMLENYNRIAAIKNVEEAYLKKTGEKLLKGRVKVSYAVNKNKEELRQKLKPYEETRGELFKEYRDLEAEQRAIKEKQKEEDEQAKAEGRDSEKVSVNIILREGKEMNEYSKKLEELLAIEEEVNIHRISIEQLEGLDLSSEELDLFMFMLKD